MRRTVEESESSNSEEDTDTANLQAGNQFGPSAEFSDADDFLISTSFANPLDPIVLFDSPRSSTPVEGGELTPLPDLNVPPVVDLRIRVLDPDRYRLVWPTPSTPAVTVNVDLPNPDTPPQSGLWLRDK